MQNVRIRLEAIVWVGEFSDSIFSRQNNHTFREEVVDRNGAIARNFRRSVNFFASNVANATGQQVRVVWFENQIID